MESEEILKKLQCNAEIVEQYIEDGTFGKGAEMTVGSDPAGKPSIIINIGKVEVEEWLIKQLETVLGEVFMNEFRTPDLIFPSYSLVYAAGCPTKIYLNYSVCTYEDAYDFSKAKEYLENECTPEVISHYCSDSLESLWKIHGVMGEEELVVTLNNFKEIAATLQICKELADKITIKEE